MASERKLDKLSRIPLFNGLNSGQLTTLDGLLHAKTFPAGTVLFSIEQPGEVAYIILSGSVKVHVEQADGREVILTLLGPGELVGELSLVDSVGRSGTVSTMEETDTLWISREDFQSCLATIPAMTHNLVRILAKRLRLANARVQSLAAQDVYGRVAYLILALAEEYGEEVPDSTDIVIPLHLTQSDLANLVGASRVRVNQVLGFYRQRGYLMIDPENRIVVQNKAALDQRCT